MLDKAWLKDNVIYMYKCYHLSQNIRDVSRNIYNYMRSLIIICISIYLNDKWNLYTFFAMKFIYIFCNKLAKYEVTLIYIYIDKYHIIYLYR